MSKHRKTLPQLGPKLFLTDGGLETTLVFHDGMDLPYFAACDLMRNPEGQARLRDYFETYIGIAQASGHGFILEAPTWRASADWGQRLGYSPEELAAINRQSIALMEELRAEFETDKLPMVVSGCIGPRGDGYDPGQVMTAEAAQAYHSEQIATLKDAGADLVTAMTMTNIPEVIGITRASVAAEIPVAISFTLETDGRLPTGESLREAVETVDQATSGAPAYYMINCAHPTHFAKMLDEGGEWLNRLRGLRANASKRSHAELDASTDLDAGDPAELGSEYQSLIGRHGNITILGGCCGTDRRHIEAIAKACCHPA